LWGKEGKTNDLRRAGRIIGGGRKGRLGGEGDIMGKGLESDGGKVPASFAGKEPWRRREGGDLDRGVDSGSYDGRQKQRFTTCIQEGASRTKKWEKKEDTKKERGEGGPLHLSKALGMVDHWGPSNCWSMETGKAHLMNRKEVKGGCPL